MTPITRNNATSPTTIPTIAPADNPPLSFELEGLESVEPVTQISPSVVECIPEPEGTLDLPVVCFIPEITCGLEIVPVGPESLGF